MHFLTLPDDIHALLMRHLGVADAVILGQTCRQLRTVCVNLSVWDQVRTQLKLPPPRPRAWKRTTAFSIVSHATCKCCRARKHLPKLPVCLGCMDGTPVLGRLRRHTHYLTKRINRRQSAIYWQTQNLNQVLAYVPFQYQAYYKQLQKTQLNQLLDMQARCVTQQGYESLLTRYWRPSTSSS